MADHPVTTHRIDRNGTIIQVDTAWLEFARANRYPGDPGAVIGQSLWRSISDIETRCLYQELVGRASTRGPLQLEYRCDAPDLRRFMEMTISFDVDTHATTFENRTLRTEARPILALLDAGVERIEGEFLRVCSWCKRAEYEAHEWIEIENLVNRLRLFHRKRLPQLSHGICPACTERIRATGQ